MQNRKFSVTRLVSIGLMAALVFVTSKFLTIPIPAFAGVPTRIHLGNVMCILSGLLFGGLSGGLSAGIGSMFMDLLDPIYITSAPTTLINKFVMGFLAGKISHSFGKNGTSTKVNIIAAICGQFAYIILYLATTFISMSIQGHDIHTIWVSVAEKGLVSSINGIIAVAIAVPLAAVMRKALKGTGVFAA